LKNANIAYLIAFILAFVSFKNSAMSDETASIISKVLIAYGGDTLTSANSIKLVDYNKGPWPGESENPGLPEIWRINEELVIDFKNKRKSLLSYRVPRTTVDLEKWIFDGSKGIKYDILHKKYSNEDWVSYENLGGSIIRSSDTMHAKQLHNEINEANYIRDEYFRGKVHQKLEVTLKSGAKYTYFIDKQSGLIRKVRRHHPSASLVYVFSNHQMTDGLTYASDMNFFVNSDLRLTSVLRKIELNPDLKKAFTKLNHYKAWGDTMDSTELMTQKLAEGIYQIGINRSKTVFIEQDNHYIAVGGASALKDNYEELKKLTSNNKPLHHFIVTHHHRGNLSGLSIPIQLGAKLVVTKEHKETVAKSLTEPYTEDNFIVIRDRKPFTLGNLTLFDIPTAHSRHNLLAFSTKNKMIIAEEHYETDLVSAKPRIHKDMVTFGKALNSLNLDVEHLIDTRSARKISIKEFTLWISDFEEKTCPVGYVICSKG